MQERERYEGSRLACFCGWTEPEKVRKLPIDPGIQDVQVKRLEAAVQSEIVRGFQSRNYRVMETSERRKPVRCPRCSHAFVPHHGRPGVSIGLGDLLIRPKVKAFRAWWKMIEVKGTETAVTPAQEILEQEGDIVIVRSWPEALHAVEGESE